MANRAAVSTGSTTSETGRRPYAAGRVAFLTMLTEVRDAVRAGIPIQQVYRVRRDRLVGISYRQFARYVERYVTRSREHDPLAVPRQPRKARPPIAARCSGGPLLPATERRRGFEYKAEGSDVAKKENLV